MQNPFPKPIFSTAIVAFVAIVCISFLKPALELEDAEQAYYSQWWRLGYDDQPPLYTWIQIILTKIFGLNRFSLAGLRGLCFSATLLLMYSLAKRILKKVDLAILSVWCMALIPVFIDFNFRRLSHTSMMCLVVLATLLTVHSLTRSSSWKNYALLGFVLGIGMLTKYNYGLLVIALLVVCCFDKEARSILWNKKTLLTAIIAGCIVAPHCYWLFTEHAYFSTIQEQVAIKAASNGNGILVISPLFKTIKTLFTIALPLLVVVLTFVLLKRIHLHKKTPQNWFSKLFWIQLIVAITLFTILGVEKVEQRWLLPILLPYVILIFRYFQINETKRAIRIGWIAFVSIIGIQTLRTPIEMLIGISSSTHYSYSPFAEMLETKYPTKQWVLSDVTAAGEVYFLKQEHGSFSADDFTLPKAIIDTTNTVFVRKTIAPTLKNIIVTDSITDFGHYHEDYIFYQYQQKTPNN